MTQPQTIKEALAPFYSPHGSYFQHIQNKRLSIEMTQWATTDKVLALFNKICKHYDSFETHPDRLVSICDSLNIKTIPALQDFMTYCNSSPIDLVGLFHWLFPKLTRRYFSTEMTYYDVDSFINTMIPGIIEKLPGPIGHTVDNKIITDMTYKLIPVDKFQYVIERCPSDRFKYIKDARDCDDFTRIVKGWLSEQGLGNLALGGVHANLYLKDKFIGAHSFLIGIIENPDKTKSIMFGDGNMDSKVWKLGDPPNMIVNSDRIKITKIMI
jgi:hypothetical protein